MVGGRLESQINNIKHYPGVSGPVRARKLVRRMSEDVDFKIVTQPDTQLSRRYLAPDPN